MFSRSFIAATFLLSACGGQGTQDSKPDPSAFLEVSPPILVFGYLTLEESESQGFTVTNTGEAPLTVYGVEVQTGQSAFSVLSNNSFTLQANERQEISVAFTPQFADENHGTIRVMSDTSNGSGVVELLGFGAVPQLQITPEAFEFEEVMVPCGESQVLTLTNIGSEPLVISDLEYATSGLGSLSLESGELFENGPVTLSSNDSIEVRVHFDPTALGSEEGELKVWSNDPRGVQTATQQGQGGFLDFTETFTTTSAPLVDVVFLVDQSNGMYTYESQLAAGLPDFFTELSAVADWQAALVVDADACMRNDLVTPDLPNAGLLIASEAFSGFGLNVDTLTEALLSYGQTALEQSVAGGCNVQMVRDNSLLYLIMISDEKEQSSGYWQDYVDYFITQKGAASLVKVSAVADLTSGDSCGGGLVGGAAGYSDAADYTGGVVLDICDSDFGSQLGSLASVVNPSPYPSYRLSHPSIGPIQSVLVNGVLTTDFLYDETVDEVRIVTPEVSDGDVVEIEYSPPGQCE